MPVDVMKIEFTAEDKTQMVIDAVKKNVQGVSNEVTSVVDRYKGYAAAMVAVFAVREMIEFADQVIKSMAALKQMSEVTGASIEALAEFRRVTKLSGTDMDLVGQGLTKLSKGMTDFSSDGGQARNALEQLGISAVDQAGNLKKPDQVMKEVAITLSQYKDGAGKTAAVMDIFGKSGAQLLPMLNDLAEQEKRVAAMSDEERDAYYGKLQAQAEVAKRSDEYEKTLTRISAESGKWKSVLVQGMIPALADAAQAFYEVVVKSGGLAEELQKLVDDGSIQEWTRLGVVGITVLMDALEYLWRLVKSVFETIVAYGKNVADTLYAIGSAGIAIIEGRYKDAWENLKLAPKGVADNMQDLAKTMDATWGPSTAGDRMRQRLAELRAGLGQTGEAQDELDYKSRQAKDTIDKVTQAYAALAVAVSQANAALLKAAGDGTIKALDQQYKDGILSVTDYYTQKAALQQAGLDAEQAELLRRLDIQKAEIAALQAKGAKESEILKAQEQLVKETLVKLGENQIKYGDVLRTQAEGARKATEEYAKAIEASTKGIDSQIESVLTQTERLGMNEKQVRDLTLAQMEYRLELLKVAGGNDDATGSYDRQVAALTAAVEAQRRYVLASDVLDGQRQQLDFWNKVADGAGEFGKALLTGPGTALQKLKDWAKSLLEELLGLFAKRFVLQIAASITGLGSLDALAAGTGQGTFAGTLLNSITGGLSNFGSSIMSAFGSALNGLGGNFFGGMGAMFGNIAAEGLVAGFTGTVSAGVQALMAGNLAGGIGTLLGPIGIALGAVAMLVNLFGDKGENPKLQFGWGPDAIAQSFVGVFGPEGFVNIQTNDSFNKALEAAMLKISNAFDTNIAKWLSPEELATVIGNLANVNTHEFAFPQGDQTMGEQALMEWLKQKYSTVLQPIDAAFSDVVKNWTGTSEDLVKTIGVQLAQWQAVSTAVETVTGAIGLMPPEALKAKLELVNMAGGMQQFTSQANFYLQNFYTDAERQAKTMADAQKAVTDGFAALGVAVPRSKDDFRKLVEGLDLNSESGRKMYTALMAMAPAFATVQNASDAAAAAMLGRWAQVQQITGQAAGAPTLATLLGQFRSGHDWAATGQYADNAFLVNQLSMIQQGDYAGYSATDQQLIIDILQAAQAAGLIGGNNTGTGSTTGTGGNSGTDTGSSGSGSTGGSYGISVSSTLGAAEWAQCVEQGVVAALARANITQDTAKNDARYDELRGNTRFIADTVGQVFLLVRDNGTATADNTRRTAAATEQLAAAGNRL